MSIASRSGLVAAAIFALVLSRTSAAHGQSRDGEGAPAPAKREPAPERTGATASPTPDVLQPSVPKPGPAEPEKPKPWSLAVFGYLRAGYDHTMKDERFEFVGRNNGLVLDSARIGVEGTNQDYGVTFRLSMEGASDVLSAPNTPIGSLAVRLRDAFARWDPVDWLGVQAGQYKAPFQEEELRGTPDLMFASRAVGVEGVPPARGFQTPGIQLDRQLGVMLSPSKPIGGDLGIAYYLMVMNGNGSNQLLDDNGRFGLVARSEIGWQKYFRVGAALFRNDRTVGTLPNLYNEEDLGLTGDLAVKAEGLEVFGAVTRLRTVFPTVGTSARVQLAFHGQLAYRFTFDSFFVAPGYRYAYFHPWQEGGADEGFDSFKLQYHTVGVRVGMTKLPIQAWLNYTIAGEAEGRKLDNDRVELLGQVTF
jgi:hypothetical protein